MFAEPFNIKEETLANDKYHKVFRTTKYQQVTLRSLHPGEELSWEVHPNTTQFIRLEGGAGKIQKGSTDSRYKQNYDYVVVKVGRKRNRIYVRSHEDLEDDFADVIIEGTWHRIYVPSYYSEPMKLYIIYSGEILHDEDEVQDRQHAYPI